jgi:hypothetical protein
MDSVRFGRALGFGARSAAKALITAVDAAATPSPSAPTPARPRPSPPAIPTPHAAAAQGSPAPQTSFQTPPPAQPVQAAARTAARATAQVQKNVQQTRAGVARGSKRFGTSVWRPFVKLSGVLWLEMTGSFFALFALFAAQSTWAHRADLHQTALNHTAHQHFLVSCGVTLGFAYFSVSSFLRARRRSRAH